MSSAITAPSAALTRPKIYILDAFHKAGIALARQHTDVVCWPDPAIRNWPEDADGVMVRMTLRTINEIFGRLMDQPIKKFVLPDYPLVGCNSTQDLPRKNGKLQVRGENYHTDHSNDIAPPKATSLLAVEIPSYGGDTQFVDVRRAYDDLSATQKTAVKNLRSQHVHESSRSPRSFAKLNPEDMVIWDNRSVMHQANADDDPEEYRYLYRVMLQGDKLRPCA